jgi:RNA polymerase sigma-70 factor (ECF subfamily)
MDIISRATGRRKTVEQAVDWELVYRELVPKVYKFFCYQVGDRDIAEDLMATTFERAWHGRSRFSHELGDFSNWLFGIARNVSIDYIRSKRSTVSIDEIIPLSTKESLELSVERKSEFERLYFLLERLEERERMLISLKYGAGFNNRRISEITGLSESNVGTILHRVVIRLRGQWEDES